MVAPLLALMSLLAFLHEGPTLAHVERIEIDWEDATPPGEEFRIRH